MKPPEHPLGHAFEKARDWQADQERQLTDAQRHAFDDIKNRQALEKRRQQDRIDVVRTQLQEKAKARKPRGELNLNPPYLVADPYIRRQARFVIAAEKRLERLDRSHSDEQKKTLKEFEQERKKEKAGKDFATAWKDALQRTARQENEKDERQYMHKNLDKTR